MAHMIEIIDGVAQLAYAGEKPWHGLGKQVPNDLTPEQMMEAAGLNWDVDLVPAYCNIAGKKVATGHSALVRSSDNKVLDIVTDDWKPCQNSEAFEFFTDFVACGNMEMNTAGSLRGGRVVWALAKVKDSFDLFGGDLVDGYLLFTNPHLYGQSIDVRFTPIRVVCNNTLTLSLNTKSKKMAKVSHRIDFNGKEVKEMLGIAKDKLQKYKEMANFLGSKLYSVDNLVEYYNKVFPIVTQKDKSRKEISKNAKIALDIIEQQPGSEFAKGSWWQAFNGVTFMTDHIIGRSNDNRLTSSWFGANKNLKNKALELAVEYANAA